MTLKEIVAQIAPNSDWQNSYKRYVNVFIESAIKFENWQDWDKDVFFEFFERSADQCVSSLKQGYFTKEEQAKIKDNWVSLSPLLKELAENQNEPNWSLYDEINKVLKQYTTQNRQAATNRLIAALQPQLLCTIVANSHLRILFKKLQAGLQDNLLPNYGNDNWYKNSYNILQYFKRELETEDSFAIMTYPWQLKDSWSPKGFNVFFDIIAQAEDIVEEQNLPFKIQEPTDYFVWISDSKNVIGNTIAHYEFHKYRNGITVNIHFEDARTKDLFLKNIDQLPPKIKWIEWQNSKSIRYDQSFKLYEENVAHKLVNALSELNSSIGDRIRKIIMQIDHLGEINHNMDKITKLLQFKKQIILQGPPGTGKTYTAKDIAEYMIRGKVSLDKKDQKVVLEDSEQFKLIQFHPAYSYEDFVRGITVKNNGNKIEYLTENKIFCSIVAEANQAFSQGFSQNDFDKYYPEFCVEIRNQLNENVENIFSSKHKLYAVTGHLNGRDATIIFGEPGASTYNQVRPDAVKRLFLKTIGIEQDSESIEVDKYAELILNKFIEYLKSKVLKFILVIDEINRANLPSVLGELIYALEYRGEPVDSMYAIDGDRKFIIPPNLYIIGTMNTADRSVGHIDYAIRRRFAFVDLLPNPGPIKEFALPKFKQVSELFIKNYESITNWENPQLERSDLLAPDFRPEDVWIGHSYFIADNEEQLRIKLQYEVKPILKEYLKDGILLDGAKSIIDSIG